MSRPRALALLVLLGTSGVFGCAEPADFRVLSSHTLLEVNRIVEIEDGYAVAGSHGLFAYRHDAAEQWHVPMDGMANALRRLDDDDLVVSTLNDHGSGPIDVNLYRVDAAGALSELTTVEVGKSLPSAAFTPAGVAVIKSCDYPEGCSSWTVGQAGEVEYDLSPDTCQSHVPVEGDGRFVLRTRYTDEMWSARDVDLVRLEQDGTPRWSTRFDPGAHEGYPLGHRIHAGPEGSVFVSFTLGRPDAETGGSKQFHVVQRFGATGEIGDERITPQASGVQMPVVRPGGGTVWIRQEDSTVELRLDNGDDERTAELTIDEYFGPVMDAVFIGDVLYLLENDGLIRVAVPRMTEPN